MNHGEPISLTDAENFLRMYVGWLRNPSILSITGIVTFFPWACFCIGLLVVVEMAKNPPTTI